MHEGELGRVERVGQVGEEGLELPRRQHPLVDDGARAERGEVDLRLPLGPLAQAEGQPVEAERDLAPDGASDEELLERGHAGPGGSPDELTVDGHLAPAEHLEVLGDGDRLDAGLGGGPIVGIGRQEGDTGRVRAAVR